MEECLSMAQVSILVNGSPTLPFSMQRGVTQGDVLSPFLFLVIVEGFNCLLDKAKSVRLIEGIFINSTVDNLSLFSSQMIF